MLERDESYTRPFLPLREDAVQPGAIDNSVRPAQYRLQDTGSVIQVSLPQRWQLLGIQRSVERIDIAWRIWAARNCIAWW